MLDCLNDNDLETLTSHWLQRETVLHWFAKRSSIIARYEVSDFRWDTVRNESAGCACVFYKRTEGEELRGMKVDHFMKP
jgi:hypothetical protein